MNQLEYALKEMSIYKTQSGKQQKLLKTQVEENSTMVFNVKEIAKEQDELLLALNVELLNLKYNLTEE